jgi:uncharacterized protein YheU (UPF0270 family)
MLLQIPWSALSEEALRGLLEEYASRDGTDYGAVEVPLARRVRHLGEQLRRGEVVIVFDVDTGASNLVPAGTWTDRP